MFLRLGLFGLLFLCASCAGVTYKDPLEKALSSKNPLIKRVMDNVEHHEIQIRYTQIDRKNDSIIFKDFDFQVDKNDYFYPAAAPIIYAFFLLTVLIYLQIRRPISYDARAELLELFAGCE